MSFCYKKRLFQINILTLTFVLIEKTLLQINC